MAVFSVDSEAVESATATARSTSDRVRADIATMVGVLVQLDATWTGAASSAFQGQVQNWRATQQIVDQALDSLNAALAMAGRTYAETEIATAGMFR